MLMTSIMKREQTQSINLKSPDLKMFFLRLFSAQDRFQIN